MISVRANSKRIAYGVKQYTVDTEADLKKIILSTAFPGSVAFVLETSTKYILNNKKEWIKVKSSSTSGGSSSGGSSGSNDDYDGGSIDGTDPDTGGDSDGEQDGGSIDGTDPI